MLNITNNSINKHVKTEDYQSLSEVESKTSSKTLIRVMTTVLIILIGLLFLPWTQNISGNGQVTTLKPGQRPQAINSVIPGRVEEWFVQEGDYVSKGDTILRISEIKDAYFDPNLVDRTRNQANAKGSSVKAYENKVSSLEGQIEALINTKRLKYQQAENKVRQAQLKISSDSIEFVAAKTNFDIAQKQVDRFAALQEEGLKSLTDLENRKLQLQKTQAELIAKENKLLTSRNELINAKVELNSIEAQYTDKITKAQSEKFTAVSNQYDAETELIKLENQLTNYSIRNGMYFIKAPQDGYVTRAVQRGIGETFKEGAEIVTIMPADYQLAVEMYVEPIDLPLLTTGQRVRIQFDGWPAIVFSGWENTSFGTFGGKIFAIDNFISPNGKYRVMVEPDMTEQTWPEALRIGAGTNAIIMLQEVSVWYELWRKINGFPPNYYQPIAQQGK